MKVRSGIGIKVVGSDQLKKNTVILEPSSLEVVDSPGVPGLEPRVPLESSEVPLDPPTGLPLVELHPPPPPQYNNEPPDR